jgi:hypothetical protein
MPSELTIMYDGLVKVIEGSGRVLLQLNIPAFAWRNAGRNMTL